MRPVIFGEILYDHFPDGSAVLGGAPFNVAWHLKALGSDPLLISRVGADEEGRQVLAAMGEWAMDTRGMQTDALHPTGKVRVELHAGEPSFAIEAERAYDFIDAAPTLRLAVDDALLYHGTLARRHRTSREALERLLAHLACPVFLDINLRAPWWQADELPGVLERAAWIKVNEGELATVSTVLGLPSGVPQAQAEALLQRTGAAYVVVTLGAEGALAVGSDGNVTRTQPQSGIRVVDSVGAGDAFSAGLLTGLLQGWPPALALPRAQALASAVCGLRGAVSRDPAFYQDILEQWRR